MSRPPLAQDPIAEARRQWVEHGWPQAAPGMAALTSVVRAHQILMTRVEETLRPLQLTFARYELLTLLSFTRSGSMTLSRLGSLLQVHPASVTNAVDRCQDQGLLERRPHPGDRRATLAVLTEVGRARADQATRQLNDQVFTDLGLDGPDTERLFAVLARLRAANGDFRPDAATGSG